MEDETYNGVWQVWQKEKQSTKLQQIPKTFYDDTFKFISSNQNTTDTGQTTNENVQRLLNNIYERRKQKILIYLAYNQTPPQPMPKEEERFYSKLASILNEEKLQHGQERGKEDTAFIVVQDVPKIVLPSGKEIGPLEKDKLIVVEDEHDRSFLLNNNICRQG